MLRGIDALMDRLEEVQLNILNQPPADALSRSLWAMGARLAALDTAGLAAEAEALGITPNDVRDMARTYEKCRP